MLRINHRFYQVLRARIYATPLSSVKTTIVLFKIRFLHAITDRETFLLVEKHLSDKLDLQYPPADGPIKAKKSFPVAMKYRGRRNHIPLPHTTEAWLCTTKFEAICIWHELYRLRPLTRNQGKVIMSSSRLWCGTCESGKQRIWGCISKL